MARFTAGLPATALTGLDFHQQDPFEGFHQLIFESLLPKLCLARYYLGVLNLHDSARGAVRLTLNDRHMDVGLGQFALATNEASVSYDATQTGIDVALRRSKVNSLPNGLQLATGEFSVVSALLKEPSLSELQNSKSLRKHYNQICKNACALTIATGSHGLYKTMR